MVDFAKLLTCPERIVVDRFTDWRGSMDELECGHFVLAQFNFLTRHRCRQCAETGTGGEVVALHDIRCGCYRCTERPPCP